MIYSTTPHFHIIQDAKALLRHLKNQYESALTTVIKLQEKMDKAKSKGCHQKYAVKLGYAKAQLMAAESLHKDTATLINWLQYDVFQFPGLPPEDLRHAV